eukprot:6806371-Lingulodinium_polyedra.AAC.1
MAVCRTTLCVPLCSIRARLACVIHNTMDPMSRASADKRQPAGMARNSAIPSRRRGTLGRLRTPRPARG